MSVNLLEIDDLHVKAGEKEILKGLSLSIPFNEIPAIMGPMGPENLSSQMFYPGKKIIKLHPVKLYLKMKILQSYNQMKYLI